MYYPKQIPYLLNREFRENIEYKEYLIKELDSYCMCIWQMQSEKKLEKTIYNHILPDACIDIVIDFSNKNICFAGFSKETELLQLNGIIDYMGVRLKPSAFYVLFGVDATQVMDNRIEFSQIDSQHCINEIFVFNNTDDRLNILKQYLLEKMKDKSNQDFIEMVELLYKSPKEQDVVKIAESFGYHERHLLRIFKRSYGVSPKVLLNILRLQFCLTLLLEENMNLLDIANLCGFYDQSHFIKEIKRYTGISPLKLLESYK